MAQGLLGKAPARGRSSGDRFGDASCIQFAARWSCSITASSRPGLSARCLRIWCVNKRYRLRNVRRTPKLKLVVNNPPRVTIKEEAA